MFDISPYKNSIEIDEPITYVTRQKQKIILYPVLTKDANKFISSYDILRLNKNATDSIAIIQSSYLQFLFQAVLYEDFFGKTNEVDFAHSPYYWKFINIMKLCFGMDKIDEQFLIQVNRKGKIVLSIHGSYVNYKDFDNLIQLIMYQNIHGYEDEDDMNEDVKEAINEYYSLIGKGKETVTLERKFSIVSAHTGILKKDLLSMTYYSFISLFEAVIEEIDYIVNKNIEANGGKFKRPIDHFVYKEKRGKYADAFGDKKDLENKINAKQRKGQ